jgi:cytochrome c oxidase subunit 3
MDSTRTSFRGLLTNPFGLFIHLILLGIIILFAGMLVAYLFASNQESWEAFSLPRVFWVSTASVLLISWTLRKALTAYDLESSPRFRTALLASALLALLFVTCQWIGWRSMHQTGMPLSGSPSAGYIYVISGLHALHVFVGIILLIVAMARAYKYLADPATTLVYFDDNGRRLKLRLLLHYWNTIDYLWLVLFAAFLFKHA